MTESSAQRPGENERERLERVGRAEVPSVDAAYADRLEAQLRVDHAGLASAGSRRWGISVPQVLAGLAVVLIAVVGVVGLTARSTQDQGTSLDVFTQPDSADGSDNAPPDIAGPDTDQSDGDDPGAGAAAPEPTATPDSAAVEPEAVEPAPVTPPAAPTPVPTVEAPSSETEPVPTVAPAATPVPTAPPQPEPTPTAAATPSPTATTQPTATPTPPAPTPTPTPTPTTEVVEATPVPLPTSTPTPSPTSTPVAAPIVARCEARIAGDAIGVVCSWDPVEGIDLTGYRVMRTRNGEAREVVANVAPQETMTVDRRVRAGDTITYRVLAIAGDVVRSESQPIVVNVAN